MTTTALRYAYISGAPAAVQLAWTDFAIEQDTRQPRAHFIPAMGGCFVVLQKAASSVAPLSWLIPSKRADVVDTLQRFKLRFESQ